MLGHIIFVYALLMHMLAGEGVTVRSEPRRDQIAALAED